MAIRPTKPLFPKFATMFVMLPTTEKSPKNLPKISSENIDTPKRAAINLPKPPIISVTFVRYCILYNFFLDLLSRDNK